MGRCNLFDDLLKTATDQRREGLVEVPQTFLTVTVYDAILVEVPAHPCCRALSREPFVGVSRLCFTNCDGKDKYFVVAVTGGQQVQCSVSVDRVLGEDSVHCCKFEATPVL